MHETASLWWFLSSLQIHCNLEVFFAGSTLVRSSSLSRSLCSLFSTDLQLNLTPSTTATATLLRPPLSSSLQNYAFSEG
ncbi:hypothetical protein L6164_031079 [Bauhinia variegata]|uniref:Uncharacterized protein n=1 Tax=Bauhinia variegata TaxID=167791 RepID=A0ACB9LEC2_BAUVA|nr:hypothetical protein L6164_031079 [Bauhinia variegata]